MNLIFSADNNWGIGRENDLLFRTPGDMAFFRKMTTGKVVVMGRKTLESLPGGKPLPNRTSIVLTRDPSFACEGAAVCRSPEELFAALSAYGDEDIFVIGGAEVYRLLTPYCGRAYVTRWDACAEADCAVPSLDAAPGWRLDERSPVQCEKGVSYCFCTYVQEHPQDWRK